MKTYKGVKIEQVQSDGKNVAYTATVIATPASNYSLGFESNKPYELSADSLMGLKQQIDIVANKQKGKWEYLRYCDFLDIAWQYNPADYAY